MSVPQNHFEAAEGSVAIEDIDKKGSTREDLFCGDRGSLIILGKINILQQSLHQHPSDRVLPLHNTNFVVPMCRCQVKVDLEVVQL